tara:strand:+ start:158 stop:769 length:612 start_codon:yes stop_codon:yes gene_type:complete
MENIFTNIYDKKIWGIGSGSGSNVSKDTLKYIQLLESIINNKEYDIKTICDIGCGDWNFSKFINFGDKEYLGIDCVKSVIENNIKNYENQNIRFIHKIVNDDYIPKGYDLIIIKDVIQHWTDEDILNYLNQILINNKFVFSTNGYKFMRDKKKNDLKNRDINNKYRYHPVDVNKYPLSEFKEYVLTENKNRAKQMILFTKYFT